MAKVVVNLATGLEGPERVTVAFLVAGAAAARGQPTAMFPTKEDVRLGRASFAEAVACEGCPPLAQLFRQFADAAGELLVCPICATARGVEESSLVPSARLAGATPLMERIGDEAASVFSY